MKRFNFSLLVTILILPFGLLQAKEVPADRFAGLALSCVHQEYPNKIAHVMSGDEDVGPPRELTPVFYGCFDWHSSVHGHWLLVRLLRLHGDKEFSEEAISVLEQSFQAEKVATEVEYALHGQRSSFERPYGIAWLLQLMAELREWNDPVANKWLAVLEPLETVYVEKTSAWLQKLAYPIRIGEHAQSAFAFALFLDWAKAAGNSEFHELVKARSLEFYGQDVNCPMDYEPGGQDFLSPCLAEADLMRRVMSQDAYAEWLSGFMPRIPTDGTADWLPLAVITDRTDGKLAHLDGLHISRAWALDGMADGLPEKDARIAAIRAASERQGSSGLAAVTGEHYEGGHWLGSFATYLVTERGTSSGQESPAKMSFGPARAGLSKMLSRMAQHEQVLNAVIALNPEVDVQARTLDEELAGGHRRGAFHGLPVLIKDNIESKELPTTAGSLALKDNYTLRDAEITRRMRDAGLLIAGKTNLSEWANMRSDNSTSGWSAVGGLTRNAWDADRNACGSSSGSAVAVAAGYVPFAIGTETDGSIVCPASYNGVVGIKPTVGLVSRAGIVPLALSQDTAGPIAYSVKAAAYLLSVMEGEAADDPVTSEVRLQFGRDYVSDLSRDALKNLRVGVIRSNVYGDGSDAVFQQAVMDIKIAGGELVDELEFPEWPEELWDPSYEVLRFEFKHYINIYLAGLSGDLGKLTLEGLIAFNEAHPEQEMPWFGQNIFLDSNKKTGLENREYQDALSSIRNFTRSAIDDLLLEHKLDLLVLPTNSVPSKLDLILGDGRGGGFSSMAAVSGYPHITVPSGRVKGMPIGLSFVGTAFSEPMLLRAAYAYEQATRHGTTLAGDDPWGLEKRFSENSGNEGLTLRGIVGESLAIPGLVAEGARCEIAESKEGESNACQ